MAQNEFGGELKNLAEEGRFVMYSYGLKIFVRFSRKIYFDPKIRIGPILAVNHGMGIGSASIMMNEILKEGCPVNVFSTFVLITNTLKSSFSTVS